MKRIKSTREKKKKEILTHLKKRLLYFLGEFKKNLSTIKCIDARVDFFFRCNPTERAILLKIFQQEEERENIEIVEYYRGKK